MLASDAPVSIGKVSLTVHDLDAVSRYYEDALGLAVLSSEPGRRRLGTADAVLLELREDRQARRRSPREAGLFHTAFLVPTRGDLARWIKHAQAKRLAVQGASDHLVSEAIYLADPEGNGIEIYVDRPRSAWPLKDGAIQMASDPLDIEDLIKQAGAEAWRGFPTGGIVGHVHLQVGAIAPAETFYTGALGMDLTCRYPGGSFFSTGGYHHHLAGNIWNSRGAEPRSFPSTGLADVELLAAGQAAVDAVRQGAARLDVEVESTSEGISLKDPWGTSFSIARKD